MKTESTKTYNQKRSEILEILKIKGIYEIPRNNDLYDRAIENIIENGEANYCDASMDYLVPINT